MTAPQRPAESSPENPVDIHIDRALAALRLAEPRGGREQMQQRLLHALAVAPTPHPSALARLQQTLRHRTWLTAAAATTAVALLTVSALLLHRSTQKPIAPEQTAANSATPRILGAPFIAQPHRAMSGVAMPTPTIPLSSRPAASQPRTPKIGWPILSRSLRKGGVAVPTPTTTPDEATLLADLHAPSHPAPPLPLAPQEKALLAVLRHANAVDLASLSDLDPVTRATRDDDETAAFHAFFLDPPPLPQPNGDTE